MQNFLKIISFVLAVPFLASAQAVDSEAFFVPNLGQWEGDFQYKARLQSGALFFTKTGMVMHLQTSEPHDHSENHSHQPAENQKAVALKMTWENGNSNPELTPDSEKEFYHNYFIGKDSTKWRGGVPVFSTLEYQEIYPKINVKYGSQNGHLKYDFILKPNADVSPIKMKYEGIEKLEMHRGKLHIETANGHLTEWIPKAYQIIDNEEVLVKCRYVLEGNSVRFKLGNYDKNHALVIDPILEFSSFTGSAADNWGFTATPGPNGEFYGGGIALQNGFPTTTGAYQIARGGDSSDVTINKFSADGQQMLYSTYLGGSGNEMPQSLIVDAQGNLIVMGATGSSDFPMKNNAWQSTFANGGNRKVNIFRFPNGSNIFIAKMSANGQNLLASTYLGGNGSEGINPKVFRNYGDRSRGEVVTLDNGDIAIASSSLSDDLPFLNAGANLLNNSQNAIVAVFSPDLGTLRWGTYYGGSGNESGYAIRGYGNNIYLAGGTGSTDLMVSNNAIKSSNGGQYDGYLAMFDQFNGSFKEGTYIGGSSVDQVFLMEKDKHGFIYVFGQTKGGVPSTPGHYGQASGQQFVQKYKNDLSALEWSTRWGSPQGKTDLVPTAFMVDQCFNIYMSGWGGNTNQGNGLNGGNTNGLPITPDAFQSTTDGSDFYFMVLDRNAQNLLYASYFGGTANEHVDGGTSRFSPSGIIYQAVCAGCQGLSFPTTPSAFSPNNPSSNCNLGAIKMDLQQTVRAEPAIDLSTNVDTLCDRLEVKLTNHSYRGDIYHWDFGNGETSTHFEPTVVFDQFGSYQIRLIAEDTVCDISDTAFVTIEHDRGVRPQASIDLKYSGCDQDYKAAFFNTSNEVNQFSWDFGDGNTSSEENPVHFYADSGSYQIRLIALDTACNKADTVFGEVIFSDTTVAPIVSVFHPDCGRGQLDVNIQNARNRLIYKWVKEGGDTFYGIEPNLKYDAPGVYSLKSILIDTACGYEYVQDFDVVIDEIGRPVHIPNAFSPNGDGVNDAFQVFGDHCARGDFLKIYNRWGEVVFETQAPFAEFWDGLQPDKRAPQGVYTYIMKAGGTMHRGYLTLFR